MADQNNVEVRITGSVDPSVAAATQATSQSFAKLGATLQQLGSQFNAAQAGMGRLAAEMNAARAVADGLANSGLGTLPGKLNEAERAAGGLRLGTAGVTQELIRMGRAVAMGRFDMLPSEMMTLASRMGGLSIATLGAVAAVAALTAGLAYLVIKAVQTENALEGVITQARLAANIQTTQKDLEEMGNRIAQSSEQSKKAIYDIAGAYASIRGSSTESIEALTQATAQWVDVTGTKATSATKEFVNILNAEQTSAKELSTIFPALASSRVKDAQGLIDQLQTAQRDQDTRAESIALIKIMQTELAFEAEQHEHVASGIMHSFMNFGAYIGLVLAGETTESAQNALLADQANKWNAAANSLGKYLDALNKSKTTSNPLQDTPSGMDKMRDALAAFDASWKGSEQGRLQGEISTMRKIVSEHGLSAKEIEQIDREINEKQGELNRQRYSAAQRASRQTITDAQQLANEVNTITNQDLDSDKQIAQMRIQANREMNQQKYNDGQISKEQMLAADREFVQQEDQLEIDRLTTAMSLNRDNLAEYNRLLDEMKVAREKLALDLAKIDNDIAEAGRKAAEKETMDWRQANSVILSSEDQFIQGMFSGRQTLVGGLLNLSRNLVEKEIEADLKYWTERALLEAEGLSLSKAKETGGLLTHLFTEQGKTAATVAGTGERAAATTAEQTTENAGFLVRLARWVASELGMTSATTAGAAQRTATQEAATAEGIAETSAKNLAAAQSYIAVAATGAASSVAWIPIIGPALAVTAASATEADLQPFAALASFDVGTNYVPHDMVAQVHQGERIIPRADNAALIEAMRGNGGVGDSHAWHYAPTHVYQQPTNVVSALQNDRRNFKSFIESMMRNGELRMGPR